MLTVALVALMASSCGRGEEEQATVSPTPTSPIIRTSTPTATPLSGATRAPVSTAIDASAKRGFSPGVYYGQPSEVPFVTNLAYLDETLKTDIRWSGVGFDMRPDAVVFADFENIILVQRSGEKRKLRVPGLSQIARPSFSPDGKKVAVQALGSSGSDLNIYVINLDTGDAERISFLTVNEESPEWFPGQNKIAYSSFSPSDGLNIHVYDLDAGREMLSFEEGAIHLAISPDGSMIFNPQLVRLYDAATGSLVSDLRTKVLAGLNSLGYEPDTRFPGQAGRGAFPLDADFSPDGSHIVFDGAVERNGTYGVAIFRMTVAGDEMTLLTGMIGVEPANSNDHNFSQLNPSWLGDQ